MKFQLPKNDLSNRDEEGRSELKNVIIKIWLGSMFWNITFIPFSDEEVKDIRTILDEEI